MSRKPKKVKDISPPKQPEFKRKYLEPKTDGQRNLIETIANNTITFCSGKVGTGKTAIAISYAVQHFIGFQCDKIVLTRPIVEGGHEKIGYLPGNADEKIAPYLIPMFDELSKYFSQPEIMKHKNEKVIEVIPLAHMRGRTLKNAVIVLDEASNATYEQLLMFITRIGENSKMIIVGDPEQSDIYQKENAMTVFMEKLKDVDGVGLAYLTTKDIVRHPIIGKILENLK